MPAARSATDSGVEPGVVRIATPAVLNSPPVIGGFHLESDDDTAESIRRHREIIAGLRAPNPH